MVTLKMGALDWLLSCLSADSRSGESVGENAIDCSPTFIGDGFIGDRLRGLPSTGGSSGDCIGGRGTTTALEMLIRRI